MAQPVNSWKEFRNFLIDLRDEDTKEMYLTEYFPGQTVEKLKANCAWDLKVSPSVIETAPPTEEEIAIIRAIDPTGFYLG